MIASHLSSDKFLKKINKIKYNQYKDKFNLRASISKTSIKGLYFNCGWGTGGFKATPGSGDLFAHTIANDEPHKLNAAFNINRFVSGDLVDEHGAAAVAH